MRVMAAVMHGLIVTLPACEIHPALFHFAAAILAAAAFAALFVH